MDMKMYNASISSEIPDGSNVRGAASTSLDGAGKATPPYFPLHPLGSLARFAGGNAGADVHRHPLAKERHRREEKRDKDGEVDSERGGIRGRNRRGEKESARGRNNATPGEFLLHTVLPPQRHRPQPPTLQCDVAIPTGNSPCNAGHPAWSRLSK